MIRNPSDKNIVTLLPKKRERNENKFIKLQQKQLDSLLDSSWKKYTWTKEIQSEFYEKNVNEFKKFIFSMLVGGKITQDNCNFGWDSWVLNLDQVFEFEWIIIFFEWRKNDFIISYYF